MEIKWLFVLIMVAMGVLLINFNITFGASEPGVVINEFLPNPVETPESNYEFIELYNYGDTAVNITGWTLEDASGKNYTLTGTIDAGEFKVFWRNETGITLNNGEDMIYLNNSAGTIVDSYHYTSSSEGKSWARIPDGTGEWQEADPTPGEPNNVVISIGTVIGNMTVPIRIYCPNASNIGSADINITYNSSVCVITGVTNGSFDFTYANLEENKTGLVCLDAF